MFDPIDDEYFADSPGSRFSTPMIMLKTNNTSIVTSVRISLQPYPKHFMILLDALILKPRQIIHGVLLLECPKDSMMID